MPRPLIEAPLATTEVAEEVLKRALECVYPPDDIDARATQVLWRLLSTGLLIVDARG